MRQLLRIILLSLSISAVETGILYLVLEQQVKNEHAITLDDPSITNEADLTRARYSPNSNNYRQSRIQQKSTPQPQSDGRVYRR